MKFSLFVRLALLVSLFCWPGGMVSLKAETEGRNDQESTFREALIESAMVPIWGAVEFFDTTLPGTLAPYDLSLEFRPRLGDLPRRGFIRYPFTLRYGYAEGLEIGSRFTPVSPNPFRSREEERKWSLGEIAPFVRVDIPSPWLRIWDQATLEFRLRQPLGRPPERLIDGHTRIEPILTFSRTIVDDPHTILYLSLKYDYAVGAWGRSKPDPDRVLRQDIFEISPGVLYKPEQLGYFFQYTLRHTDEPTEYRIAHVYHAGVVWDVPPEQSQSLRLPGRWQVEAGYELTDEQRRSVNHSITVRIRWRGDLKALLPRRDGPPE